MRTLDEFTRGREVRTIVPVWHGFTRPRGTRGTVTSVSPGVAGESYSLRITTDDGPVIVWPWEVETV